MLNLSYAQWQARTYDRLAQAGFGDIRPAHSPVFRNVGPEGTRIVDLAALASMTKQSMSYLVEDLQKLGYVTLEPDPDDGRAKRVCFTQRGAEAETTLAAISTSLEADLEKLVGKEAVNRLRAALESIVSDPGM